LNRRSHITVLAFISFALLFIGAASTAARAALGGSADSVGADAATFGAASVTQTPRSAQNAPGLATYTAVQMTTAAGIAVTEYIAPGGRVFAVSWRGRRPPDLSILLGSYFGPYQDAAIAGGLTAHGLHHASVRASDVTVETAGHMRDMWGRAIVPAMLPPGVNESEIR
jgi:uncharacterized protein DUF2844